jgi:hypothetical protein
VVVLSCWQVLLEQRELSWSSQLRLLHFARGPDNTEDVYTIT